MKPALARTAIQALLSRLRAGQLTVVEGGRRRTYGPGGAPSAIVEVRSEQAWPMLLRGSRGLAESYMAGLWETPDLPAVIRVAARNIVAMDELRLRLSPLREPYQRARALLMRNTPARSREDIAAHYDLGNDLFELMLDPTMMYSCAVFPRCVGAAAAGPGDQARAGLRQARAASRGPAAGDRHRAGAAWPSTRPVRAAVT